MPSISRLAFAALLLLIASVTAPAQSDPWKLPNKKANPPKPIVRSEWQEPARACSFLADIPGMQTRGYKNDPSLPKEYFCSSPYKTIGKGWPLENNLAYYVLGDANTAKELKIVLNVNAARTAEAGHSALAIASGVLTKRALGADLPHEVLEALILGTPGKWNDGTNQIQVVREDWSTGRGYEVKFIIR